MTKRWVLLLVFGALIEWVGRGEAEDRSPSRSQTLLPQFDNDAVTVWKTILAAKGVVDRDGQQRATG
jgi:hypothetical protein